MLIYAIISLKTVFPDPGRSCETTETRCLFWFAFIRVSPVHLYCFHENYGKAFSISNKSENTNGIIEVQILEVTSMGLCGCNVKEQLESLNGTNKGTI